MEEHLIFGDNIEIISHNGYSDNHSIFNIHPYYSNIYLKIKNTCVFEFELHGINGTSSFNRQDLLMINKIFGMESLFTEEYVYIPLYIIIMKKINNKPITFHLYLQYLNIQNTDSKIIKIKSEKQVNYNDIDFWILRDNIYKNMSTGICVDMYFIMIIVKDSFIENTTDVCGIKIRTLNQDNKFISFEEMDVESFDIYDGYDYVSGYVYFVNFSGVSNFEFLGSLVDGTLSKTVKSCESILAIELLGDISKHNIHLISKKN